MASSPRISALDLPYDKNCRSHESSIVIRAQRSSDEGRSRHIVDANLRILKCRIEEARMNERLEKCYLRGQHGWDYTGTQYVNHRNALQQQPWQSIEVVGLVGQMFGITILSATLGLCLAAIFLHMMNF